MSGREIDVRRARRLIGNKKLDTFLRAIRRDRGVLAVSLINERLDRGESLDKIFYTGNKYGFRLTVTRNSALSFDISFGCIAGPLAGDGGSWHVEFNDHNEVVSVENRGIFIC